ncbi:glycosyl hydrolase 53 family protein [Flavobacterium cellulosilyticum]|uniref:Arabinogalactan endo-beta-1,4-galactanase n=1 Tax=Flavobacterium cellulosilyticum TaxID=2541731 RepID=A0A4R5CC66_9FLAO|nr:glycosyl hydrolase 53 family protein [Flavobacterium cellulosilyticum]TDD94702.1 T9SS type A sorting domain-containing protein [Flavobacterium cellulosilyticum]
MKKIHAQFRIILMSLLMLMTCYYSNAQNPLFSKGGDVSWLPQMEATGYKFYDLDGSEKDCLQLLKDKGLNTIRLRVWVNPSNDRASGHCSPAETVVMAVRAKNLGMRIMIDFHYSDSWADPGKQAKPAAWASHTFAGLLNDVYNHTFDVLNALKNVGVTPEWVQIGNEIPNGMLFPEGSTSNWSQLAQLLNKGYDATKAVDPSIKVIVHIDKGNDNGRSRKFYDNATTNNVKYDVIGLSYYPYWLNSDYTATIGALQTNLNDMASRYGKEVMIVEVGGDYTLVQNTYDMLVAVIAAVKNVPNGKGIGVNYWEPEGEKSWSGYQLSAWQSNGKPSEALNAFSDTLGPPVIVANEQVKINGFAANPVEQGKNVVANLTYTSNNASDYFYVGLFKRNSSGGWLKTIAESTANQFLVASTGTDVTSQIALGIPLATIPTANLTNGEYYDLYVELWTANWGGKLGSSLSSKLTIAASGSLGIDDNNFENELLMYPNPVTDILNFKNTSETAIQSVKITNILGKTVYSDTDATDKSAIDVSNLSSGMYILSVNSGGKTQQLKFSKK